MRQRRNPILASIYGRDPFVEAAEIQPIADHRRFGEGRSQFALWFGVQSSALGVAAGFAGPTLFGLTLVYSLIAALVGTTLGTLLLARMSLFGPATGLSGMPLGRFVLGRIPGAVLSLGAWVFLAVAGGIPLTLGAVGVLTAFPHARGEYGDALIPLALAVGTGLASWMGYRFIHLWQRGASFAAGYLILVFAFILLLFHHPQDGSVTTTHLGASLSGMAVLSFVLCAAWAPFAPAFSRYLPAGTKTAKPAFWGAALGTLAAQAAGILLATEAHGVTYATALRQLLGGGWLASALLVVLALSVLSPLMAGCYASALADEAVLPSSSPWTSVMRRVYYFPFVGWCFAWAFVEHKNLQAGQEVVMAASWVVPYCLILLYLVMTRPWLFSPSAWQSKRFTKRSPFGVCVFLAGLLGVWLGMIPLHDFGVLGQGLIGKTAGVDLAPVLAAAFTLALLVGRDIYSILWRTSIDVPRVA